MAIFVNIFSAIAIRLAMLGDALAALGKLAWLAVTGKLKSEATEPATVRAGLALLRAFCPNLVLSWRAVKAYDNTGTVIVTRDADVREVLNREADFAVVYEPKMRLLTGGENFFLGMQNTPRYQRDVSNMRLAIRREDLPGIVTPLAAARAQALVAACQGRIDVPRDLTLRVPHALVADYFGTPGPTEAQMVAWTTAMFWYLFIDLEGVDTVTKAGLAAAADCRAYLDGAVAARKAAPTGADDVLGRCLEMQAGGLPGMSDLDIRNNLIGMVIGAIPTISKASIQALDVLMDRPKDLADAQAAARSGDDAALAAILFEALRFNPLNPVIYRRANQETRIARGTLRARTVPKGAMVMAANLSAMFDRMALPAPNDFRPGRPWSTYILWGYGMHTCSGDYINRAVIPAMLKPLLAKPGLRRAAGAAGRIDSRAADGTTTPFPTSWTLEFD